MPSKFTTISNAIKTDIVTMGLTGVTADKIRQQQFPANPADGMLTEGIFLCPVDEILPNTGTNRTNETHYGVIVVMLAKSNGVLGMTALDPLLTWREAIRIRYHHRRPINVGAKRFYCEPGRTVLPAAFEKNFDASALLIRAVVNEG